MENLINDDLDPSSSVDSDSKSDNEFDNEVCFNNTNNNNNDNNNNNNNNNKSLIVCINYALLGFYLY